MSRFWPKSLSGQIALLMAIALLIAQAINFALMLRERERLILTQVSAPTIARLIDAVERDRAGQAVERRYHHLPAWRGIRLTERSVVSADMRPRRDIVERASAAFEELAIPVLRIEAAEGDIRRDDRPNRLAQTRRAVIDQDRATAPDARRDRAGGAPTLDQCDRQTALSRPSRHLLADRADLDPLCGDAGAP